MKKFNYLLVLSILLLSFRHIAGNEKPTSNSNIQAQPPVELTDLKNIGFAWNLTDWEGNHVDSLSMDVYYPTGATSDKKYPVVLMCHAGGFTGGDKSNVSALCDMLADYGFICVSFNYRTGYLKSTNVHSCTGDSTTLWNAVYRSMQDANACLRFVNAKGTSYNMDTTLIFCAGTSAGASTILNSAYCNDSTARIYWSREYAELGGVDASGNTLPNNYKVNGLAAMWGSLYSDKVIDTNFRAYPTILFKGDEDSGLPDSVGYYFNCTAYAPAVYAGAGIYAKTVQQKTPCVYYELPGANHPAYDDEFCIANVACFFRNVITKTTYSGRFTYYTQSCPQFNGEY